MRKRLDLAKNAKVWPFYYALFGNDIRRLGRVATKS